MNWYKVKGYLINLDEIVLIKTQEHYINLYHSKINKIKTIYFKDVAEASYYFDMISDELLRHNNMKFIKVKDYIILIDNNILIVYKHSHCYIMIDTKEGKNTEIYYKDKDIRDSVFEQITDMLIKIDKEVI